MSSNPFEPIFKTCDSFARAVQTHLSHLLSAPRGGPQAGNRPPPPLLTLFSRPTAPGDSAPLQPKEVISAAPVTKEELGRATWTLLHTVAAQTMAKVRFEITPAEAIATCLSACNDTFHDYDFGAGNSHVEFPDHPTRQQKRDAKELMAILSRLYPCKECADHFKEVLKANPVRAGSQDEFSQWLCHVHNVVNRSIGKVTFPCQRVNARWGKLECKDRACDVQGSSDLISKLP